MLYVSKMYKGVFKVKKSDKYSPRINQNVLEEDPTLAQQAAHNNFYSFVK